MEPNGDIPTVTREQLADAVRRLGVAAGDTLYVHSSLKSLGRMDGGADGVVDALLAAVGRDGNVAVPTHSGCIRGRQNAQPFDPATTPSKTGAITEALRLRPQAARSLHPTHSVSVIGPAAGDLTADHDVDGHTTSLLGPHGRLVRANAWILFVGAGLHANTTYHAAEDWMDLPFMPDAVGLVSGPHGVREVPLINFPVGDRNFYRNSAGDMINEHLASAGVLIEGRLNQTPLLLVRARDVIRETCNLEMAQPGGTLCASPACDFCREGRIKCQQQHEAVAARAREILATPQLTDPAA